MFLTNLSQREKVLVYFTVSVIFVSLVYNFALKSFAEKWSQINSQILNKEIELKRNIKYLRQEKDTESLYQRYMQYVKKEGSDEEEMAALLKEVEGAARSFQIRIANMRPRPMQDLSFYKKYILEMDCEASMERYIEFIYTLQKSTQLIRVEKLKLSSQGKDTPLLKAQMLITKVLVTE